MLDRFERTYLKFIADEVFEDQSGHHSDLNGVRSLVEFIGKRRDKFALNIIRIEKNTYWVVVTCLLNGNFALLASFLLYGKVIGHFELTCIVGGS